MTTARLIRWALEIAGVAALVAAAVMWWGVAPAVLIGGVYLILASTYTARDAPNEGGR